jgi:hypothetical protein
VSSALSLRSDLPVAQISILVLCAAAAQDNESLKKTLRSLSQTVLSVASYRQQYVQFPIPMVSSFRLDMLELPWLVYKVVGVSFRDNPPLVWLLHKILISLLLRELYRFLFRSEIEMCALHRISG